MVSYSSIAEWGASMGKHERIKDKPRSVSPDEEAKMGVQSYRKRKYMAWDKTKERIVRA